MSLLGATESIQQMADGGVSLRVVKTRRHEIQMTKPWWRDERCDEPSGEKRQIKPFYAEGLSLSSNVLWKERKP
jgi:hypothetical protein